MTMYSALLLINTYVYVYLGVCGVCGKDWQVQEAYYWRDYAGKIPYDALPGGTDSSGEETYIGQTVYTRYGEPILVPGKVSRSEKEMTFEWGTNEHKVTENFKILCTPYPEHFQWIETNSTHIKGLAREDLIPGGFESDFEIYIGRDKIGEALSVGKILILKDDQWYKGFHTTLNGKYVHSISFEVLSYNNIKGVNAE